eukprot:2982094-Pyramimonas_sp.AAC.1
MALAAGWRGRLHEKGARSQWASTRAPIPWARRPRSNRRTHVSKAAAGYLGSQGDLGHQTARCCKAA